MGYWIFHEDEHRRQLEGRYWNPSDNDEHNPLSLNICIVASITKEIDWSAYIGGAPRAHTEAEALKVVAEYGAKLSEKDARYFFPDIELPYRH